MNNVKSKVKDFTKDPKTHQKMRYNLKIMVSEVKPHTKKISENVKKMLGLLMLLWSFFWIIIVLGLISQVLLMLEFLTDKNLVWLNELMCFYQEISINSSDYSIGSVVLFTFVSVPLIGCFFWFKNVF